MNAERAGWKMAMSYKGGIDITAHNSRYCRDRDLIRI